MYVVLEMKILMTGPNQILEFIFIKTFTGCPNTVLLFLGRRTCGHRVRTVYIKCNTKICVF